MKYTLAAQQVYFLRESLDKMRNPEDALTIQELMAHSPTDGMDTKCSYPEPAKKSATGTNRFTSHHQPSGVSSF